MLSEWAARKGRVSFNCRHLCMGSVTIWWAVVEGIWQYCRRLDLDFRDPTQSTYLRFYGLWFLGWLPHQFVMVRHGHSACVCVCLVIRPLQAKPDFSCCTFRLTPTQGSSLPSSRICTAEFIKNKGNWHRGCGSGAVLMLHTCEAPGFDPGHRKNE